MDPTLNDSWSNTDVEKKDKWVTKTNKTKVVIAYSWKKIWFNNPESATKHILYIPKERVSHWPLRHGKNSHTIKHHLLR